MNILLSPFYFGTVQHYQLFACADKVIIDTGEHFMKQSYRNRTTIVGPNGTQDLVVQTRRDHGRKVPMKEMGVSYAENWQEQHLHAIRSAYGSAPWFIHYYDELAQCIVKQYNGLLELDLATMRMALGWLGATVEIEVSPEYVEDAEEAGYVDLRQTLHPKKVLPATVPFAQPYHQVFLERHGFIERMSVIDVIMNAGPEAKQIIAAGDHDARSFFN